MELTDLSADMTVEELLARWSAVVPVFRRYAENCIGCSLDTFCTISDAAKEYDVPVETILNELITSIGDQLHA